MRGSTNAWFLQTLLAVSLSSVTPVLAQPLPGLADAEQNARNCMNNHDYEKAAQFYGQAAGILQSAGKISERLAGNYLAQSGALQQEGNYAAAIEPCQKALSLIPQLQATSPDLLSRALMSMAHAKAGLGQFEEAISDASQAQSIIEKQYGANSAQLIPILTALSTFTSTQAKFAQGEDFAQRALAIIGSDEKSPLLPNLLRLLGEMKIEQGHYTEAESLLKRGLGICENITPPDYFEIATLLDRLAGAYAGMKRIDDAESMLNKAIAVAHKADKPTIIKDRQIVWFIIKLADIYNNEAKHDQAETQLTIAQDLAKTSFAPGHYVNAVILNHLASTYIQQGKYAEAEKFYRQVLAITQDNAANGKLPKSGPFQLGVTAKEKVEVEVPINEKRDTAIFGEALDLSKKTAGTSLHPVVASALSNLGYVCLAQDKLNDALTFYQQALDTNKAIFGINSRNAAGGMRSIAAVFEKQQNYDKAITLNQQALEIYRKLDGNYRLEMVKTMCRMAGIYVEMKDLSKAEQALRDALKTADGPIAVTKKIDPNALMEEAAEQVSLKANEGLAATALSLHMDQAMAKGDSLEASVLLQLSIVLQKEAKLKEAETLCRKAVELRQQNLGPDRPLVAQGDAALAAILEDEKQYPEALTLMQQAVAICQKKFGNQSLQYASALHKLAQAETFAGKAVDAKEHEAEATTVEDNLSHHSADGGRSTGD
jgi:tetratricopeptide (TPR) repeat protein